MMKLITTRELGRLCKWLRIMGFDAAYYPQDDKRELVIKSLREDRIILSRDSRMARYSGVRLLHIKSDFIEEQVRQVINEVPLDIDKGSFFTRCILCNERLAPTGKEEVKDSVPAYVFETHDKFMACPLCGKIYWQGTHWDNVEDFMSRLGID